jgi:glucose/arabinose dehydrogenase
MNAKVLAPPALVIFAVLSLPGQIYFNPSSSFVSEGDGTNQMTFVLTLSQPATNVVTVNYQTSATNPYDPPSYRATAFANVDYLPTNGTLTFAAGSTSQTFTVTFFGDILKEPDKYFWVVYGSPAGASFRRVGDEVITGYIFDDDPSNLLPGFKSTIIASNLNFPTRMEFAPDGRLFICEQEGNIRIVKAGQLLPTPFLSLNVDTEDLAEAGLLGLAFDPGFTNNQYFYLFYSAWNGAPYTFPAYNRVSRFTANGDSASTNTELIILQSTNLITTGRHNAGDLHFGPDGALFVSIGDGLSGAQSQSLSALKGKILRLNADGSIPADNPFYSSVSNEYRAIWAMGLRNPFAFTFQPGGGSMFINDVGENTWEEINAGTAGANYGWPEAEGYSTNTSFQNPTYSYIHPPELPSCGGAITGGAFYNPATNRFRGQDFGRYFFADYCLGWIKEMDPSNGNAVSLFATEISRPVDIKIGPDGNLYCLSWNPGSVLKIEYATPPLKLTPIIAPGNSAIILSWHSEIGESYRVQLKNALSDQTWMNVGPPVLATTAVSALTNGINGTAGYFRVFKQ